MIVQALDRLGNTERIIKKDHEKRQQDKTVDPCQQGGIRTVDHLIIGHQAQYDDGQQAEGDFLPDRTFRNGERKDNGGYTQDQKDIANVAAQHIADRNIAVAPCTGQDVDKQLRGGRTKCYYRQADDEIGDLEPPGDGRGAIDQEVGTLD